MRSSKSSKKLTQSKPTEMLEPKYDWTFLHSYIFYSVFYRYDKKTLTSYVICAPNNLGHVSEPDATNPGFIRLQDAIYYATKNFIPKTAGMKIAPDGIVNKKYTLSPTWRIVCINHKKQLRITLKTKNDPKDYVRRYRRNNPGKIHGAKIYIINASIPLPRPADSPFPGSYKDHLWCPYCNDQRKFVFSSQLKTYRCKICRVTVNDFMVKRENDLFIHELTETGKIVLIDENKKQIKKRRILEANEREILEMKGKTNESPERNSNTTKTSRVKELRGKQGKHSKPHKQKNKGRN